MFTRVSPFVVVGFALLLLSSCGTLKRVAVGTTADLLYEATPSLESESDYELFKASVLPNIKLIEGLLSLKPRDPDLLAALIKAYTGYGFGVYESEDLSFLIRDEEQRPWRERALLFYSRALQYGERYLENEEVNFSALMAQIRESKSDEYLDRHLDGKSSRDLEAALFTAQALAGLANYHRDNMMLVAQLPLAKALFDWACGHKQDLNYGACDLFYGAYYGSRPKTLGGDPELGMAHFEKALKLYPDNYLIHAAYLQYYIVPMSEQKRYKELKSVLLEASEEFEAGKHWSPLETKERRPYALYQAIGLKRALDLIKLEKEWL